jgi:hypothetical protein
MFNLPSTPPSRYRAVDSGEFQMHVAAGSWGAPCGVLAYEAWSYLITNGFKKSTLTADFALILSYLVGHS